MLQRARANQWARIALLLVVLGFCSYGLVVDWPHVQPWIGKLRPYSIAGSIAAAIAGAGCMMMAWQVILADLGSRLPILVAARVTFVAQLGKYVPGAIWSFAAHVELGHDYQVPRRRGAASVIVALAVAIAVGLLTAAVALPLSSPALARRYLLAMAVVPVIVICLAPPVLHRILNTGLRLIRQQPLDQPLTWRGLAVALGWTVLGWLLFGMQAWLLVAGIAKDGAHSILLAMGAYALACTLALLLVVFPNGIGAREVLLAAALSSVLPYGAALAVALMARVVTTVSDLAWGGFALAIGRRSSAVALRVPGRHRRSADQANARQPERAAASPRSPEAAA